MLQLLEPYAEPIGIAIIIGLSLGILAVPFISALCGRKRRRTRPAEANHEKERPRTERSGHKSEAAALGALLVAGVVLEIIFPDNEAISYATIGLTGAFAACLTDYWKKKRLS
ncbi:hypothetical protein CU254_25545 [Amycolatopsis sp. AA4]|uniref:hypothetical protein n=1 Tax=Actinomycetes TaxID=1760 RepID=UPI0001B53AE4|nr:MULTISPECIES: hypothetical protein [Actinomycetes]ATY13423.1 hypothetical protein CU254_25545 [Amycolatopsis sp. AA4]EFL09357.1 predicted protein [Streptomyces sp. AA4]